MLIPLYQGNCVFRIYIDKIGLPCVKFLNKIGVYIEDQKFCKTSHAHRSTKATTASPRQT